MCNVFGLIVSGRLVHTDFTVVSETQFLITIHEADGINHAAVFLTGAAPLPAGTAGMVYWSWPDPSAPPNWMLLGHISNSKPSAFFKISGLKKLHELSNENQFSSTFGQQQICHNAQIGISIEPEANVQLLASSVELVSTAVYTWSLEINSEFNVSQCEKMTYGRSKTPIEFQYRIGSQAIIEEDEEQQTTSYVTFAQKMLENLVNFVASFAVTQDQMTPTPGVSYIPLNTLQTWYQNFERRLVQNPNFWKN